MNRFFVASRAAAAAWCVAALPALCGLLGGPAVSAAEPDLEAQQEEAFRNAVERVGPAVVRVDTIGGLEQIGQGQAKVLVGTGPSTGLVVDAEGYILSSAFNFAQKPTSILIGLPDGSRAPAKLVATDSNRMLVLLKIEAKELGIRLTPAVPAPSADVKVGQWSIAVGRTFDGGKPNVSVGIVSALNRIWGKAVQTDAKISPANYGGPLIDIEGRVIGVLAPLSPTATSELAGFEWYDSGIGFAVPLDQILRVLPALKEGKNLRPGIMGVVFKNLDDLGSEPVITGVRGGSPAADAQLKAGDKIVELDGKPIKRLHQVRHTLGPHYGGDKVKIAVLRDGKRIEAELTLVSELLPYQFPFLGVVPKWGKAGDGVIVRGIVPDSPAAKAGLQADDRIVGLGGKPIADLDGFEELRQQIKPGDALALEVKRGSVDLKVQLEAAPDLAWQPAKLEPLAPAGPAPADAAPTGLLKDRKIAEFNNSYTAYVPTTYRADRPAPLLLWLHEPGGYDPDKLVATWKPLCEKYGFVFLAPKSSEADRWLPTEVEFIGKAIEEFGKTYPLDPRRIAAAGYQGGGGMAQLVTARDRERIRGTALIEPIPSAPLGDNEPGRRLRVWTAFAKESPNLKSCEKLLAKLAEQKIPVVRTDLGKGGPRPLEAAENEALARWLDALDAF